MVILSLFSSHSRDSVYLLHTLPPRYTLLTPCPLCTGAECVARSGGGERVSQSAGTCLDRGSKPVCPWISLKLHRTLRTVETDMKNPLTFSEAGPPPARILRSVALNGPASRGQVYPGVHVVTPDLWNCHLKIVSKTLTFRLEVQEECVFSLS